MNEHTATISVNVKDKSDISQYVYEVANFTPIASSDLDTLRYLSIKLWDFILFQFLIFCRKRSFTVPVCIKLCPIPSTFDKWKILLLKIHMYERHIK